MDQVNNSISAAMGQVNQLLEKSVQNYVETAKVEEESRKKEAKKIANKINEDIDVQLEKANLMKQLQ